MEESAVTGWKRADLPRNVPIPGVAADLCDDLLDDLLQVYRPHFGLSPPKPGERQQIVDQVTHSFG